MTRTTKVVCAPAWIGFAGPAQVAQVRRTLTTKGSTNVEVVYLITSADHATAPPAALAAWVQDHPGIENRLTGWDNIADALRHHARNPNRAPTYLLT